MKFRRRPPEEAPPPVERTEVRQYRYLLATASAEVIEHAHLRALSAVDPLVRAVVLRSAQDRLLSGRELTVDDVAQLAHLVTMGEIRTPGVVVAGLNEMALERLANAILRVVDGSVLAGCEDWDGVDPDARQSVLRLPAPREPAPSEPTPGRHRQPLGQRA